PPLLHLHSCPTRRSSDLERHARALLRIPQEQQMLEVVHRVVVEELNVKKTEELVSQVMADLRDQLVQSHDQKVKRSLGDLRLITDRKSTRLNSSHVSISY